MKRILFMLILLTTLVGCRAPKTLTSNAEHEVKNDIENNISFEDSLRIEQTFHRLLQKYLNEKLSIKVEKKVYDTDKPIVPGTGKPPLKEEVVTGIEREINEVTNDSTHVEEEVNNHTKIEDKSTDKSEVKSSEHTKTETGLTTLQKVLIIIGSLALLWLALFIIKKLK